MAELVFFTGPMDCGKSTLALQTDHTQRAAGRRGRLFTQHDRAGAAVISSRLGLVSSAVEVRDGFNIMEFIVQSLTNGERIDYIICDETQFYPAEVIDQLADIADQLKIDVFAFGIMTDFRTELFPGSARLMELADRIEFLQARPLCWCGSRATHNARTSAGFMVSEGDQVVVGDTTAADEVGRTGLVAYEVLCRRHHRSGITRRKAGVVDHQGDPLPYDAKLLDAF